MFDAQKIQPHIVFSDLREWMREAEKLGELKTVLGASWQEEIGLAADVVIPPDDGPAVVFDEVPGCPKGFRVLINVFAGKRRNIDDNAATIRHALRQFAREHERAEKIDAERLSERFDIGVDGCRHRRPERSIVDQCIDPSETIFDLRDKIDDVRL